MFHKKKRYPTYSVGILTVSDTRAHGQKEDVSGNEMAKLVLNPEIFPTEKPKILREKVPDDKEAIMDLLSTWADELKLDLILTVGGTGFSPRDVTPEATEAVCDRKAPSITSAMAVLCYEDSPYALLSRATCGIRKKTIILNLPGSVKGSKECFLKIAKILGHAVDQLKGDFEAVEITHSETSVDVHEERSSGPSQVAMPQVALRVRTSQYPMIATNVALHIIMCHADKCGTEKKSKIRDCLGHVTADDVKAIVPSPPFRASMKDGYAVLASDGTDPRKVIGAIVAGDHPNKVSVRAGECVRVNTGAPVPKGADAVIQVEDTDACGITDVGEEKDIVVFSNPVPSLDIREVGSDISEGQVIIPSGKVITAFDCGILQAAGVDCVEVYRFPCVGLLSTGNELVESKSDLRPGTIIDSSKPVLTMLLQEMQLQYSNMGIAKDDPDDIKNRLQQAFMKNDVVIITGGVSMGEKDFVKDVLIADFGATIHFGRVNMKPGKPTVFSTVTYNDKVIPVFCLPGNPVSSIVTFHIFVVPALRKMMGYETYTQLKIKAMLADDEIDLDPRPEFHRAKVTWDEEGKATAHSTGNQLSSRLLSLSDANGLMMLPGRTADKIKLNKGENVTVLLLNYFAPQSKLAIN